MRSPCLADYDAIVTLIETDTLPCECWQKLIDLTDLAPAHELRRVDIPAEIASLVRQLKEIWSREPVPESTSYLYFGLYDLIARDMVRGRPVLYVSGGDALGPTDALSLGSVLTYQPAHRDLKCQLLERVRMAEIELPTSAEFLDYVLLLGGAAITVKGASENLDIRLPCTWVLIPETS